MSHVEDYKNTISKRKKERIEKAATEILSSLLLRQETDEMGDDIVVNMAIRLATELVEQMDKKYTVVID